MRQAMRISLQFSTSNPETYRPGEQSSKIAKRLCSPGSNNYQLFASYKIIDPLHIAQPVAMLTADDHLIQVRSES